MRQRSLLFCLLLFLLLSSVGCGGLKKKFVRPSSRAKGPTPAQLYYEEKEYPRPPHREQYEEAFLMWRVWHSESLNSLALNRKRARTSLGQALEQLTIMRGVLTEERGQELATHMERLKLAQRKLGGGAISQAVLDEVRLLIEKELRQIETAFSVDRVEASLLPDS